ncbi:MAG: ABC transporter permease [Brevinema sp.]
MDKKRLITDKMLDSLFQIGMVIFAALFVSSIIISLIGENPFTVFFVLIKGSFGDFESIVATLLQSTPIMIAGSAACIGFKSGVFNIGVEGQFYLGGIAAAVVGFMWNLPPVIHVLVALLAACVAGMLWVIIPAFFRAFYNVNEVVPTILSNYVAVLFTSYLTIEVFKVPGGWTETPPIAETAHIPRLFEFSRLNLGLFIAILIALAFYLYLKYTSNGYKMRAVGDNPKFALFGGIDTRSLIFSGMLISGAVAGFGGGIETLGVHRRFMEGFAPGFGFDGVTAALASGAHPIGMLFVALFFGALRSGSLLMEVETSISREIVTVIQAIIILFVTVKISLPKK